MRLSTRQAVTAGGRLRPIQRVQLREYFTLQWQPHVPGRLDEDELADWLAGRNAVYQLAAMTIGARLVVATA